MNTHRAYLDHRASQEASTAESCTNPVTHDCHRKMAALYAQAADHPEMLDRPDGDMTERLPSSADILVFGTLADGSAAKSRGGGQ